MGEVLDKQGFKVTDTDDGFVRLVDHFGGDDAVVQAARVSVGQGLKGEDADKRLVQFLMRNRHNTPFEHTVFKFHVKCPITVARDWLEFKWASYNEISGRYTKKVASQFFIPEDLPYASTKEHYRRLFDIYTKMLAEGVAKEHARGMIPYSFYTQFYFTINAKNLLDFINLHLPMDDFKPYLNSMKAVLKEKMPWTYESFQEHRKFQNRAISHSEPRIKKRKALETHTVLGKGFVKLLEVSGSDEDVISCAPSSFESSSPREIIERLFEDRSHRAFEYIVFKFRVKCPIYTFREWYRHRWASYPSYREIHSEFYLPECFRTQLSKNYEFCDLDETKNDELRALCAELIKESREMYTRYISQGIDPRKARSVLPYSFFVEFDFVVNLASMMNFINLRADIHAMWEIRQYALILARIFKKYLPYTYCAFLKKYWTGENPEIQSEESENV